MWEQTKAMIKMKSGLSKKDAVGVAIILFVCDLSSWPDRFFQQNSKVVDSNHT